MVVPVVREEIISRDIFPELGIWITAVVGANILGISS